MKKVFAMLLLLAVLAATAACAPKAATEPESATAAAAGETAAGEEADDETSAAPAQLQKIAVSEPVRGALWGPVYLAKLLGYFEEEGLDVEFITVQGDMPTAPVLSGDTQFGLYGPEMILGFNEKEQATKLLFSTTQKYPYSFVTRPGINTVADLKGKNVNGADSGSSPRAFVRSVVASEGLDPDTDVTYLNVQNAGLMAALKSGEVEGSYVSPAIRSLVLEDGNNLLIDMYDPAVHSKILNSETYEMYIVFATDKYIAENPETVQAFANASYKAMQWADTHSADEIIAVMQPMFEDDINFETTIREIKENDIFSPNGTFSESGFAAINQMAMDSGLITAPVARENAINDTFINNAQQ